MFGRILEHKITLAIGAIACIAVVGAGSYYFFKPSPHNFTTAIAQVRNINETITSDGKVDSDSHVTLSFKKGGTVSSVSVKVGDTVRKGQVLAMLDASDLYASLQGAQADVLAADANLSALQKGATVQTRTVYSQSISTASLSLATADQGAYLKVRDALQNKLDTLFQNGATSNPQIQIATESYTVRLALNASRADLTSRLDRWNKLISQNPTGGDALAEASADLLATKNFTDSLFSEANLLTPSNSGLTVSQISAFVASVNAAASEINSATSDFNSAAQAYNTARDQASVVEASSTPEAIIAAQAQIAKAQANQSLVQSQIADMSLIAPFDGIVGSVNPKVGEAFDASVPAIDVLSKGNYKIDIMVPENEIGGVMAGSQADVTFDAYGLGLEATATVATVDISETTTNGIGAYKATLYLNGSDPRIRTGMTGNVTIQGPSASSVLAIPTSAVITENGSSFALVESADTSYAKRPIQTGLSGGGWTEIRSGLSAGNIVAAFGNSSQ